MNGIQLRKYLEQNAKYWSEEDGQVVVNPAYLHQIFNYYLADGIDYTINVANQPGQRISSLTQSGIPIKEIDVFSVVMTNYLSAGGGNFDMIAACPVIAEYQDEVADIIFEYILANQPIPLDHHDNIHVVYE